MDIRSCYFCICSETEQEIELSLHPMLISVLSSNGFYCTLRLVSSLAELCFNVFAGATELFPEKKLIKDILTNYAELGKIGRPVAFDNETLKVYYGLRLMQILDLDERNQVLTTNVRATYLSFVVAHRTWFRTTMSV